MLLVYYGVSSTTYMVTKVLLCFHISSMLLNRIALVYGLMVLQLLVHQFHGCSCELLFIIVNRGRDGKQFQSWKGLFYGNQLMLHSGS